MMMTLLRSLLLSALVAVTFGDVCDVSNGMRFDCYPENGASQEGCLARGCCWRPPIVKDPNAAMDIPYCFYGSNFGYKVCGRNETKTGFSLMLCLIGPGGPYGGSYKNIIADFMFETNVRLHVKIRDVDGTRYQVPVPTPVATVQAEDLEYKVTYTQQPFGFAVQRLSTGVTIFNSSVGGLIFSIQFLQISSLLASDDIYGLGEHVLGLKLSTQWQLLTLFARDIATPVGGMNLYGVHPVYLNIENDGNANGVFLLNSNAMDILLQPTPAITYRTIGGILDFYIFLGPDPNQVVSQYTEVVGRPLMPPYWALGFHLCRWGYGNLSVMQQLRQRMAYYSIPQDVQWNDIDYMDGRFDFTLDDKSFAGLPEFVDTLHESGMHYMVITDPAIGNSRSNYQPYTAGVDMNVFIKDLTGSLLVGQVWPGTTVFPDFFAENTSVYWYTQIKNFHDVIKFDGLWIDMNEPSNFVAGSQKGCPSSPLEHPPYLPAVEGGLLYDKTICMTSRHTVNGHSELHYDLHSLYGYSESVVTTRAMQKVLGKRSLVISRSTYAGSGHHAGHWLGDNHSTWDDLYDSIAGILNFNLFGIPMVGADICGFIGDTTEELCSRWMQLGAFYPFSRNHNTIGARDQDPAAFGEQLITASKTALGQRYTLLPYLYTLFYEAYVNGTPVARPLLSQFPKDKSTYAIDSQFMWGSALLISPILTQGASSRTAYFPGGRWYDYHDGTLIDSRGEERTLPGDFDKVNLHLRGGNIVPVQNPGITTTASRFQPFGAYVALDEEGRASGIHYIDDGESLLDSPGYSSLLVHYDCANGVFRSTVEGTYVPPNFVFQILSVMGVAQRPTTVLVNGQTHSFSYNGQLLVVSGMSVAITESINVQWIH